MLRIRRHRITILIYSLAFLLFLVVLHVSLQGYSSSTQIQNLNNEKPHIISSTVEDMLARKQVKGVKKVISFDKLGHQHKIERKLEKNQENQNSDFHEGGNGRLNESNEELFKVWNDDTRTIRERINHILDQIPPIPDEDLLPKCVKPVTDFVYIKNHKCASDTLSAMFRRFGYSRNLTFVQPIRAYWNLGWPFRLEPHMHRTLKTDHFNILTEHTIYDKERLSKIMPPGTAYLTSIREPFSHLQSSLPFFNYQFHSKLENYKKPGERNMDFFLRTDNKTGFDEEYKKADERKVCVPPGLSVVRNFMSFNLDLPVGFHTTEDRTHDLVYIKNWLGQISKDFKLVSTIEKI